MGANRSQATGVTAFLLGFTFLAGGMYAGKFIFYLLALVLLAASVAVLLKAKPLEHIES